MAKKLLIGLAGLLILAVAAVLVAPSFIDWNGYKAEIAARAKAATGRDLAIDGDISLALLPAPTLSAAKVRLANLEGGDAPDMATLEALRVRVALLPLLEGRIEVERIALVGPTIILERLPDGRANWEFAGAAAPGAPTAESGGGGGAAPDIRFESVTIEDGTLVYRDLAAGTEERVEGLDADIAAESLRGPFRATGKARLRGVAAGFELSTGRLEEGSSAPLTVALKVGQTKLSFAGSATVAGADSAVAGQLKGGGPSLVALLDTLAPGARLGEASGEARAGSGLPAALADEFAIDGEVAAGPAAVEVRNLTLRLAELTASGAVSLVPGEPPRAKVALTMGHIDLDKLLGGATPTAAAVPSETAPAPAGAAGFTLPTDFEAEVDVAVEAIGYRGGVISKARLVAALANGEVALTRLSALLPGGSDVTVAGVLGAEAGAPRFAGAVEASSDNLRGLLDWLQAVPPDVPSDRLRKASLTARVTATPASLELADMDLRLDASRVTGGVVVALPQAGVRARPAFGIGLAVDQINLDAYLPPSAAAPETAAAATPDAAPAGLPLGALAPLAGFDANLELRVGSLTYNGQPLQGLHLDGTLQGGDLTLRDLSVKQFAGGKGALSGTLTGLAGTPRFDTAFTLSVSDAGKAAQLAGLAVAAPQKLGALRLGGTLAGGADDVAYDVTFSIAGIGADGAAKGKAVGFATGIPRVDTGLQLEARDAGPLFELAGLPGGAGSRLGAVSLSGTAASGADEVSYDVTLSLAGVGGRGQLAGRVTGIGGGGPRLDTRFDLGVKKPAPLFELAGIADPTGGKLGELAAVGTVAGGLDAIAIDVALKGLGGSATVAGTAATTPEPATFDLAVTATHSELRQLIAALMPDYRPGAGQLGAFAFAVKAKGSTQAATLSDLRVEAGPNRLDGSVQFDAAGTRPMVTAALRGNELDFAPFAAAAGGKPAAGGTGGGGATGPGGRWSTEPLDLSALDAFDGDLDFAADAVSLGDTRIDKPQAKLSLRDGILTVTQFNGGAYGGALDLTGRLAARGVPSASGRLAATNIEAGRLMSAGVLGGRVSGPLSLDADVQTVGVSMAELVGGLGGSGGVNGTITVLTQVEQQLGSALLNVLGAKVKQIRGLTDTVNTVYGAFTGSPNTLAGTFAIDRGIVVTDDLTLTGRDARALARGRADLPAWTLAMAADIYRQVDPAQPYLTVNLDGALDAPNVKFTGAALSGAAAAAPATGVQGILEQVVPGLAGTAPAAPAEGTATPPPAPPGGIVGGILQQIIPGVTAPAPAPAPAPAAATVPGAAGIEPPPPVVPAEPEPTTLEPPPLLIPVEPEPTTAEPAPAPGGRAPP
ncbi:MAG: AsmA family protein, partial [Dongiaceae bacterium]